MWPPGGPVGYIIAGGIFVCLYIKLHCFHFHYKPIPEGWYTYSFFEVINIFSKIPTVATHLVRESSHHICIHIRRNIINFCNVKIYLWIDNYRDRIPVLSITKLKVCVKISNFSFPSHVFFHPFEFSFFGDGRGAHLWCLIGIENQ